MNFLQLVNALRQEAGASGRDEASLQGNLYYETQRLKSWTQDAWRDIQSSKHWGFLFKEASFTIPQYASVITPPEFTAQEVADWIPSSVRIAEFGEPRAYSEAMLCCDYMDFRDGYGADPAERGTPAAIAVHPNTESLHIAPSADRQYTLYYDYFRVPQELDDDDDVPIMPARFHRLIVWEALRRYAGYEEAPGVLQRATLHAAPMWADLMRDQLPPMEVASLG